jgi:multiple sugar transport system ATP-binding protein
LRLQTREEIKRIQKKTGVTTIFVTHDQEEALSISDLIIVMRDGVVQQIGKPQEVYDDPCNLFVAKFLGTPPINVFDGRVEEGKLYIGDEAICAFCAPDGAVTVGIRPEGFVPDCDGVFTLGFVAREVLGRDISIISEHPSSLSGEVRAIVGSDVTLDESSDSVRFSLKPKKLYVFDKTTEKRIYSGE